MGLPYHHGENDGKYDKTRDNGSWWDLMGSFIMQIFWILSSFNGLFMPTDGNSFAYH
jgi:hypothetical protein